MKKILLKICMVVSMISASTAVLNAQSNQYLDFDGVDDYVSVTNGSANISGSSNISMTGWFYDNALGYGQGMMGFRGTGGGFYMIQLNNGTIECRFINSAGTLYEFVAPANTVIPQIWQHYAWVYGGGQVKLYLNGNLVGSHAATGAIASTTIPFGIGKSIQGGFNFVYNGRIDEVSVWNKALTQTEIQDIMANELVGNEPNLKMYYKFDQGVPGGNNTSITSLTSLVNSPTNDGALNLFSLTGATSNFNGTLNASTQAISFPPVGPQLIGNLSVTLNATATSGLPVSYTLLSGPGTLSGNVVTFTGPGLVTILASQAGNATFDSATSVISSFTIVDPATNTPNIDPRNPMPGTDVYMPTLGALQLAAFADIDFSSLFSVTSLQFIINGTTYTAKDFGNGHYTAWWTPSAYGPQSIQIVGTSNYGATSSVTVNVNVVQTTTDINNVIGFSNVWLYTDTNSTTRMGVLPSFVGAFDTIIATLTVTCPTGGCGAWDRVASVDAQGSDGKWFEIIRYITPYGVPCTHKINLADYMSLLQGKVNFRANCGELGNGFLYSLKFDYKEGAPAHKYSLVSQVWKAVYPFGDFANQQPVPQYNFVYPPTSVASKLKLVSTGHGWGNLNTGNAAEFYNATHDILVNGANTFTQHNWTTCNPNPDACSPQNGTWTYNRAGWCPGSIARPFDYDLSTFIPNSTLALQYQFFQTYIDQCHPNNPNCVTGTTCSDCNDGFNPMLDVNCNLITFFDDATVLSTPENELPNLVVYPNPSNGIFNLNTVKSNGKAFTVSVYNLVGTMVQQFNWDGSKTTLDLSAAAKGIYVVQVSDGNWSEIKKLVVQ